MASRSLPLGPAALAAFACAGPAFGADDEAAQLPAVSVTAPRETNSAQVSGFGDLPLSRSPLQARVLTEAQLQD
uniref:hypothetical protein n=1 Tax=Salmonella enterica TaxID=28901 RepID=UPI003FA7B544